VARIRALVVDDSVVIRRVVRNVLAADPEIDVVGVAANGRIALAMIEQLTPDALTLDLEMPDMDGLETLKQLRRTHPKLPVIMFSTVTERGALATLEALACGADDYVTKPANVGNLLEGMERIREQLIPKIKALTYRTWITANAPGPARSLPPGIVPPPGPASPAAGVRKRVQPVAAPAEVELVAIGTSTGGPNALADIVSVLPAEFPAPILVVQHMPPMFTRFLAQRLANISALPVKEAAEGDGLQPGHVFVAPGDYHMIVVRDGTSGKLRLGQEPPENSCRPSVDVLFRSVAAAFGRRALAVVLTGMGRDGLNGCEHIHEAGGQILVQDQATSVVWGMPGFVSKAGIADRELPLAEIPGELLRRTSAVSRRMAGPVARSAH